MFTSTMVLMDQTAPVRSVWKAGTNGSIALYPVLPKVYVGTAGAIPVFFSLNC